MAMRRAVGSLVRRGDLAEGIGYGLKRRLLGRPLINEQLGEQRLSKRTPIGTLTGPGRAVVEGRVHTVEIRPVAHNTVLACDIADSTGDLTALFYGRSNIPGLRPGSKVRLRGPAGMKEGMPVMVNPAYELLAQSTGRPPGKSRPRRDRRHGDGDA